MISIENIDVYGFESAIRGMRNPMNSWDRSDSVHCTLESYGHCQGCDLDGFCTEDHEDNEFVIGANDLDLMKRLFKGGTEHRKYMRMINVTMDITAPLYWWKEFDTYKIGTVANSCSTMHKIHAKEFELDDFSYEHLIDSSEKGYQFENPMGVLEYMINVLNHHREKFLETKDKKHWWQMIQLLPTSYNQRRTVQMNYEVAVNIIRQRQNHKLDEWHVMVDELLRLPYMKEIMGVE